MIDRIRPVVTPAYLFLCLLLGGSSQGIWANVFLRLTAISIIAWALLEYRHSLQPRAIRRLLVLVGLALALAVIQLVPLPVSIWSSLPGREQFLEGFQLLGIPPGRLAPSLAPYDSIATVLALLPPLGMLAAMIGLRGYSTNWLAAALIAGTVGGVLLGILQVTSANPLTSPWYLYRQSNFGVATGFFANSNHMASLLLVSIPFIAALGASARERTKEMWRKSAMLALAGGGLIVVILGLILNGSLAGYGLGLPVVFASLLMLIGPRSRFVQIGLIATAIAGVIALGLLWTAPVSRGAITSVNSRQAILSNSIELVRDYGMVGSGLGTFEKVYRMTEDPASVDRYYINHAHNDYLELAIETGLPGIILMLLFLAWWGQAVWALRSPAADYFARAAAIGSAAILLHSMVDYPLRTAAMSAVLAMCLVLTVQSRRRAQSATDLRPARHLVVG
ncbi:O-antigen ligase family protein [Sphingomonas sp. G124]|uniref:O-antigen ligase family protein n=1 Tax=Sphingomonas cremea TaxID=2904799 RepID=A0A9X1QIY8_9SPHN|nr:O-antigen ligase family protein [Sphingomonas cremea]MCF2514336.1 O-antigen ligase family protein [Sphingomonas cremea]